MWQQNLPLPAHQSLFQKGAVKKAVLTLCESGMAAEGAGRRALRTLLAQAVADGFPATLRPPETKIVTVRFPVGELLRQDFPEDAATNQIKDRLEDFPHGGDTEAPAGFRFRNESLNMEPFPISQRTEMVFLVYYSGLPD